jgi:hypothetical protein
VLEPVAPGVTDETAETVQTVGEVCETEIDEMFVNVKSVPLVVDTEEQSIWPDVAVNV